MGRNRKTTAEHEIDGTFRADRHFETAEADFAGGSPQKPNWLDQNQESLWDQIVKRIPSEYLGEIDTMALEMLMRAFGSWSKLEIQLANLQDEGGNVKQEYLLSNMISARWKQVSQMAGKFGMTPRDRVNIEKKPDKGGGGAGDSSYWDNFLQSERN